MSKILYTNVNINIHERAKEIVINPLSERFYFIDYDDTKRVFFDATLALDENGAYVIEGRQTIYSEHSAMGSDYERLLYKHPKELIKKGSLFWLHGLYSVKGFHKREVASRYTCRYKEYCISERKNIISSEFEETQSELNNA